MKKLITTIAALALAVASYGQTGVKTTSTLAEYFSGNWNGNFYAGGWGADYVPGAFSNTTYESGTTTGVSDPFAYYMTGSTGLSAGDVYSTYTDKWTLSVNTPAPSTYGLGAGNITVGSLASYDNRYSIPYWMAEGPWQGSNSITPNTFSIKVTNNTTMAGFIRFELHSAGRFDGSLVIQRLEFALPANKTSYLTANVTLSQFAGLLIRTTGIVGDIEIDDLRLGFALPTGITTLIEANNSTTVAGGGSLSFAIPSVTGSVEYANEIPFLSVSPSTLGTIDQTGAFTAGTNGGVVTITAASYGVSSMYVVTIPTVYITSSTIVGVTSLATSATSTYSISGITPSNAQDPTSTVWISSNTAVATINATTGVLTGVSVGTTNVSAKHILSNNTTITSNAIAVNVFAYVTSATVSGAAALTVGGMATYSISGITPSNAQAPTLNVFKSSNTAVATIDGTSGALKAVGAGTTTVYALHTLSNNTVITSAGVTLVVSSVAGPNSISAGLSASDFSVAPNPTTDAVSVSAPVAVSGLKVYSLTGVEVASSSTTSVSLSGASAGVYILEISTANGSVFKRVIKE